MRWRTGVSRANPNWLTATEEKALAIELARRGYNILAGQVRQTIAEAMRAARVRPAMIYAYFHTGLLVTEATRHGYSSEQLQTWEAALREDEKAG
jgi:hypothetical protein